MGNGLDRFRPDPALKPVSELCYSALGRSGCRLRV